MRWIVLVMLPLLAQPVFAGSEGEPRAGNPRGYETDILFETFGIAQEDIDAEIDQVFQGCAQRDCIPSIDQPQFLAVGEVDFLDAGGVRGYLADEPLPVHRMYWFAWYSFHPDTSLIDSRNH